MRKTSTKENRGEVVEEVRPCGRAVEAEPEEQRARRVEEVVEGGVRAGSGRVVLQDNRVAGIVVQPHPPSDRVNVVYVLEQVAPLRDGRVVAEPVLFDLHVRAVGGPGSIEEAVLGVLRHLIDRARDEAGLAVVRLQGYLDVRGRVEILGTVGAVDAEAVGASVVEIVQIRNQRGAPLVVHLDGRVQAGRELGAERVPGGDQGDADLLRLRDQLDAGLAPVAVADLSRVCQICYGENNLKRCKHNSVKWSFRHCSFQIEKFENANFGV